MKTLWAVACAAAAAFLIGTFGGCASTKSQLADFSDMKVGEGPGDALKRLTELQKSPAGDRQDSPTLGQQASAVRPSETSPAKDVTPPSAADSTRATETKSVNPKTVNSPTESAPKKSKKEAAKKRQKATSPSKTASKTTVTSDVSPPRPSEPPGKEDSPARYISRFDDLVKSKTANGSMSSSPVATPVTIPAASAPKPASPQDNTERGERTPSRQSSAVPPQPAATPPAPTASKATPSAEAQYRIGREDVLSVSVWGNQQLTMDVVVRPDGNISFPLIQDIQAEGFTASELGDRIRDKLLPYIKDPNVSVIVKQINSPKYSVIGYVNRPGTFPMRGDVTVLQALSEAGGFTPFASPKKIKLVRNAGGKQEIRMFNYYDLIEKGGEGRFLLKAGDTIVVP